ncbi:hypothetical protein Rmf_35670 [Roseomonas fluvialis]|uniref:Uncharacterized protein n=1 Tax=Roseomonas fluvialis TaxID=1750527 RepID=A0ABN6P7A2_9PROT|nr:hypothetical protein Rmf_35670 [Roseomonas fluvialis]
MGRYHARQSRRNILSVLARSPTIFRLPTLRRSNADPAAFGAFLQRQAAFVAQKTVIDYCRVKSGRHERQVFSDPDFQAALRHCRWQVYLGSLADMGALAEAWLRPHVPGREGALADALIGLHAAALAAEPPPPEEAESARHAAGAFARQLDTLQRQPPIPAQKMPLQADAPLLATIPIHPDQRIGETPAIRGALRFHVVSSQQEMERRFDPARLGANLVT